MALKSKRRLPIAPMAPEAHRHRPLLDAARPIDVATRPLLAVFEITLACDLGCRHCGSRAGRARPDELNTEECLDLIDQFADLGVAEVALIGGEAYLRDDWCQIIRRVKERGMSPIMTTGGRGMTAERAKQAAEAGLDSASVSIDGLEETHDTLRGAVGSHASAIEALRNLREAGVGVSVNSQINRLSMHELPALLERVIAEGAHSWQIQITVANGRAADEPEILLQPYDLLELFPMIDKLADRCAEADVLLWPGNNVGYFGPYEAKIRRATSPGHTGHCSAGRSGLGVEADGTIKGCPSLATANWGGGNIRDNKLVDIWQRSERLRYNREREENELWGYCRTCYYAEVCKGGCTWTGESLLGRPGNNPMCHHRALEHQSLGKRERIAQVSAAPGVPFDHGRFEIIVEDL